MTRQEPPRFGLGDEEFEAHEQHAEFEALPDQEFDAFLEDTLGEYDFEDLDLFEGSLEEEEDLFWEPWDDGPGQQPFDALSDLAARTALNWDSRSGSRAPQGASAPPPDGAVPARTEPESAEVEPIALPTPPSGTPHRRKGRGTVCSDAMLEDEELMQKLASAASAASSSREAAGLVAAMVPLALRSAPQVYRGLWAMLPALIDGAVGVTMRLYRQPGTRPLIGLALPAILRSTTAELARYVQHGQVVPQRLAAQVLARQTAAILRSRSYPRPVVRRRAKPIAPRVPRAREAYQSEDWWDNGHGS